MIDEQFGIRFLVWILQSGVILFAIICFVGIYQDRTLFIVISFILVLIEILFTVIIFGIIMGWITKNTTICGELHCYVCPTDTATYMCNSKMNDSDLECWIYEDSYNYYCHDLVIKMAVISMLLWVQLTLGTMSGFFLAYIFGILQRNSEKVMETVEIELSEVEPDLELEDGEPDDNVLM
mmetsp:Transcript_39818/g.68296  ORF Transcript_39818/g.68296 Transcript_39818/m.68296 type:complete len:180 (+) Transcript_39818:125-664(+)